MSLATEGEEALENARDLRIHELIFSTSAPPAVVEVEATGGGVSSLSVAGRKTSDRRTEPKMSCIGMYRKAESSVVMGFHCGRQKGEEIEERGVERGKKVGRFFLKKKRD